MKKVRLIFLLASVWIIFQLLFLRTIVLYMFIDSSSERIYGSGRDTQKNGVELSCRFNGKQPRLKFPKSAMASKLSKAHE